MPKFFVSPDSICGDYISVSGETVHHLLHVLRVRHGDVVIFCDGLGMDYYASLMSMPCANASKKSKKPVAVFEINNIASCLTEPAINITLFQALPKGDKLDLIIQKCVELGVGEIIPVHTERTVATAKDSLKKTIRYQKIAESAAGQSMRGKIPIIHPTQSFESTLKMKSSNFILLAYEQEDCRSLKSVLVNSTFNSISIWIGPEGGFTEGEVSALCKIGAIPVTLGRRILRTETAAISAVAQIICLCCDI